MSANNYLSGANYKIVFDKIKDVAFYTTQLNWPTVTAPNIDINTPILLTSTPTSGGIVFSEVSFDFIVDENMDNYFKVLYWIYECSLPNTKPSSYKDNRYSPESDFTVSILDNKLNHKFNVIFEASYPTSLSSPTPFSIDTDTPMVNKCSISLKYTLFYKENENPLE